MDRFSEFVRTTPAAFWFGVVGVAFSVGVFLSGVFGEESEFALIFMVPGFLTVAILSALGETPRSTARVLAVLMALVFAWFAREPRLGDTFPAIQNLVHAVALILAGGAALSLTMRHPLTRAALVPALSLAVGVVLGAVIAAAMAWNAAMLIAVGAALGVAIGSAYVKISRPRAPRSESR